MSQPLVFVPELFRSLPAPALMSLAVYSSGPQLLGALTDVYGPLPSDPEHGLWACHVSIIQKSLLGGQPPSSANKSNNREP